MSDSLPPPWTVALQAPLTMGFSRQEYWSGLPFLSPGDFPSPKIELTSPALAGRFFIPGKPLVFFMSGEGKGYYSVFLPGEAHEQRSLVGCSPGGRRVGHK